MIHRALAAAILALALGAAPAHAAEFGMQDDQAVVYGWHDRDRILEAFTAAGGDSVRVNLIHARGDADGLSEHADLAAYRSGLEAVHARGLRPQVTLLWYGQDDPARIASWSAEMARELGPLVDRWSILNEPDITIPANDACPPSVEREWERRVGARIAAVAGSTRQVRYRGRVRKVVTRTRVRRHGRVRVRRVASYRGMVAGRPVKLTRRGRRYLRTVHVPGRAARSEGETFDPKYRLTARGGCIADARGRSYARIFAAAAPAIRAADPGAQILAGETSPFPTAIDFIRGAGHLDADGWAHHAYTWERIVRLCRRCRPRDAHAGLRDRVRPARRRVPASPDAPGPPARRRPRARRAGRPAGLGLPVGAAR